MAFQLNQSVIIQLRNSWIIPDWPAPPQVRAFTTTRVGGGSCGPYASFNLATHVGDDPAAVTHNRRILRQVGGLPEEPRWLDQVHGVAVINAHRVGDCPADGCFSMTAGAVCAVLTADCLPVLFCDDLGMRVAAAHAGWRGLCAGVLEKTVAEMAVAPSRLMAWLGPAIGPQAFEVGAEVCAAFRDFDPAAAIAFRPAPRGWYADLYQLARHRLNRVGVTAIYGGNFCTFSDPQRFYSYRRDGICGRMASIIFREY